jgi:ribosome maturation factor RimP
LEEKLTDIVNKYIAESEDLFLIKVIVKGKEPMQKVLVILDGDNGVSIDKCAEISRRLGAELEETNFFEHPYNIEVSSAGIDSPLEFKRQYAKNVGRNLKISLKEDATLEGKLLGVEENGITILKKKLKKEKQPQTLTVPFEEIKKTLVTVSFK